MDPVAQKVLSMLAAVKRIPLERIALETPLEELGLDSLDTFTLLFELENQFQISIPDDDARAIRTVEDIVEGVRKLVVGRASGSDLPARAPTTE